MLEEVVAQPGHAYKVKSFSVSSLDEMSSHCTSRLGGEISFRIGSRSSDSPVRWCRRVVSGRLEVESSER